MVPIPYNYNNLKREIRMLMSKPVVNKSVYYKNKVNKIFKYINNPDIAKDIKNIKKEIVKAKELDSIYSKVLKYKEIFIAKHNEIQKIKKSLGLTIKSKK
jgi:hypothetical protein